MGQHLHTLARQLYSHFNAPSCDITASVPPLLSSGGSEYWALHMKPISLLQDAANPIHFLLCDSSHVVNCLQPAKNPPSALFHRHPSGNWIKSFRMSLSVLQAKGIRAEVKWIKVHTGF